MRGRALLGARPAGGSGPSSQAPPLEGGGAGEPNPNSAPSSSNDRRPSQISRSGGSLDGSDQGRFRHTLALSSAFQAQVRVPLAERLANMHAVGGRLGGRLPAHQLQARTWTATVNRVVGRLEQVANHLPRPAELVDRGPETFRLHRMLPRRPVRGHRPASSISQCRRRRGAGSYGRPRRASEPDPVDVDSRMLLCPTTRSTRNGPLRSTSSPRAILRRRPSSCAPRP